MFLLYPRKAKPLKCIQVEKYQRNVSFPSAISAGSKLTLASLEAELSKHELLASALKYKTLRTREHRLNLR